MQYYKFITLYTEYFFPSSLHKKVDNRASYPTLLEHAFLKLHGEINTDISQFVSKIIDQ